MFPCLQRPFIYRGEVWSINYHTCSLQDGGSKFKYFESQVSSRVFSLNVSGVLEWFRKYNMALTLTLAINGYMNLCTILGQVGKTYYG